MKTMFQKLLPCLLALSSSFAWAQKNAPLQVDIDPENERKSFQVAEGFEVNLFAGDPQMAKPIQICFDTKGRLWAACSSTYPQVLPGQPNQDKILIMEDTDGDGKADKTTVFADGLLIPTGLAPGDGGVYVVDSTDLVHLSDTDGDGKADKRRVILSGFGTEDTHHMVHSLRWGMDGLLYFNQSIYIHSHLETPYGPKRLGGGGIWQLRPDTLELDIIMRGLVNSWGHHFDKWGQSFATDGAGGEGINYVVPRGYYVTAVGAKRIIQGLNPGSPKHCGLEILSGRHLPDDWQQSFVTNDFRGHRVCRFVLEQDGSGYISRQQPEVIKTNHPAFRPVDVKQGPDGAIYIADWFNPIIQHGEVDFRDPRRDKTHGRIWRVTAKNRPLVQRPKFDDESNAKILERMSEPEMWTRHMGRRVLVERGAQEVLPDIKKWADGISKGNEPLKLEALWTFLAVNEVNEPLLKELLEAKDPHVRAAAVRVAAMWRNKISSSYDLIKQRANDSDPQTRLETVRALGLFANKDAAETALSVLDKPMDRFLEYGLWLCLQEIQDAWVNAFTKGEMTFGGKSDRLVYALQAVGTPEMARKLGDLIQQGKIPAGSLQGALAHLARVGSPAELAIVAAKAVESADANGGNSLLAILLDTSKSRQLRAQPQSGKLEALLAKPADSRSENAARLLGMWKIEPARKLLEETALAANQSVEIRSACIEAIGLLGGAKSEQLLTKLLNAADEKSLPVKTQAMVALASLNPQVASSEMSRFISLNHEASSISKVFDAFLGRKDGVAPLAASMANATVPADVAKIGIRQAKASGQNVTSLVGALEKAGKLGSMDRNLSKEQLQQMTAEIVSKGDAVQGELVFRRKELACMKCHAIQGAGGLVGPDMTSIGASAQIDYLIESLYNPNKAIKENYHALVVTTDDGKVFNGIKVRQDGSDLVLRDAEDRLVTIPLKKIEEQKNGKSLMPEGLIDSLTRQEVVNLVRFLSELGKVGPYAPGKAGVVRRYEVLLPNAEAYTVLARKGQDAIANPAENLAWTVGYTRVNGELPLGEWPRMEQKKALEKVTNVMSFVRFELETGTAGKVDVSAQGVNGLAAYVDGKPIAATAGGLKGLALAPGKHVIVFKIEGKQETLRVEVADDATSPAKVRVINLK